MNGLPQSRGAILREQTLALIGLRWAVWRRRMSTDGKWGRIVFAILALLGALAMTGLGVVLMFLLGQHLEDSPATLAEYGGPTAMLGLVLSAMLGIRLYLSVLSVATGVPFLQPRRFLVYAVPSALITAINCVAQLFEPAWLIFYAPALALAWVFSRLPSGPALPRGALALALFLLFLCAAAILQAVTALVAELFAHRIWRRVVMLFLMTGAWGVSIGLSRAARSQSALSPQHLWALARHAPPGWAAELADLLGRADWLAALGYIALLLGAGFIAALLGHKLALREARRAPETIAVAKAEQSGPAGWRIPFLSGPISALVEKEAKTIFRAMWLQMIAGPVAFLVMRFLLMQSHAGHGKPMGPLSGPILGPQPLLMGAFYAHLGVLAWSVNAFGVDGEATRGVFLWPLRGRTVLAAKNAVAYLVSLLIFLLLAGLSSLAAPLTMEQLIVGLCAHAATFPVLATLGNATSIYFPSPMRAGRLRQQPGGMTTIARMGALLLLALTGWAPYLLAKTLGVPLVAAYLGELLTMAIAYGGLLAFSEQLLENRREPLLRALAKEE